MVRIPWIEARACCRVDLAGGTLDIWPLGQLHPGSRTINLAIDLEATVRLRPRGDGFLVRQGEAQLEASSVAELSDHGEGALVGVVAEALGLPPVEVELTSDSPRGGGLGASSALAVALIAAGQELLGVDPEAQECSPQRRAHLARDLEARLMGLPTGVQDQYPALLGGALEVRHDPGGERVRRLGVDLETLTASLLVVSTGVAHFSAGQNWQVVRRRLDGEAEVRGLLAGIAEVAAELSEALEAGDLPRVGELMALEWRYRRHLAEGVTTAQIENLFQTAGALGAWGGKICGAGGGGCAALLCPPEKKAALAQQLALTGAQPLVARPSAEPLRVRRVGNGGEGSG